MTVYDEVADYLENQGRIHSNLGNVLWADCLTKYAALVREMPERLAYVDAIVSEATGSGVARSPATPDHKDSTR
jgi:prepilin-type processing-associated H-X9-DG protein